MITLAVAENEANTFGKGTLAHPVFWSIYVIMQHDTHQTKSQNAPTFLSTDASGVGISAVLSQTQEGHEVVVTCASHTLQPAERNYSTVKQEALACVWGAEKFEHFMWG